MRTKERKNMKKAQTILEYAVIIVVVVSAITAMNLYVRGSVLANLKTLENRVNADTAN